MQTNKHFFTGLFFLSVLLITCRIQALSPQTNAGETKDGSTLVRSYIDEASPEPGSVTQGKKDGAPVYIIQGRTADGKELTVGTTPLGGQIYSMAIDGKETLRQPADLSKITENNNIFCCGMPVALGSYVNRAPGGTEKATIHWKGRSVDVLVRHTWGAPFAIHGSTWFKEWKVTDYGTLKQYNAPGVTFELNSSLTEFEDVRKELFSNLIFRLTYYIRDGVLHTAFEAENPATGEIAPIQITFHPWLALEGNIEDWELILPFKSVMETDPATDNMPSGKLLDISAETVPGFKKWIFSDTGEKIAAVIALAERDGSGNVKRHDINHFFRSAVRDNAGIATIILRNPNLGISYVMTMDSNLDDFVFYSHEREGMFACMEPSKGPANGVNLLTEGHNVDIFVCDKGGKVNAGTSLGKYDERTSVPAAYTTMKITPMAA